MQAEFFIQHVDELLDIVQQAGSAIMAVYESDDFGLEYKKDDSPLTRADTLSQQILMKGISRLTPTVPVLSEESRQAPFNTRKNWTQYWCIDPLDGTKEFVNRNGEFAINVALMKNNRPVAGIVYAPVLQTFYFASDGFGCWKKSAASTPLLLENKTVPTIRSAVGSRSHAQQEEQNILQQYGVKHFIAAGSALKFCMLAEGKAQVYCRTGPTMEWDTAAGHALLNNAQCELTQLNGKVFEYNKPSLVNPGFLCKSRLVSPVQD